MRSVRPCRASGLHDADCLQISSANIANTIQAWGAPQLDLHSSHFPVLQRYPHARAVVVSTENITQNWYFGNERSMLIPNCLFRVGGAACLLSNRLQDSWRAK